MEQSSSGKADLQKKEVENKPTETEDEGTFLPTKYLVVSLGYLLILYLFYEYYCYLLRFVYFFGDFFYTYFMNIFYKYYCCISLLLKQL